MSDSLGGHHPRAADRLYCEECHQMFPCPGYLRALGVRLDDESIDEALAFGEAGIAETAEEAEPYVRDLHAAGYRVVRATPKPSLTPWLPKP